MIIIETNAKHYKIEIVFKIDNHISKRQFSAKQKIFEHQISSNLLRALSEPKSMA